MPTAHFFSLLASVISFYILLCFIRILLTWIPGAQYNTFGRILSSICDPYLNLFRRFRFLRIGVFDLSPAIALCLLIALSAILKNIAVAKSFTLGGLLAMVIYLVWSVFSSLMFFLILLLVIRLIALLMRKDNYGSIWDGLDRTLNPIVFRMTSIFTRGRPTPYKTALIIATITAAVSWLLLKMLANILMAFCSSLPI